MFRITNLYIIYAAKQQNLIIMNRIFSTPQYGQEEQPGRLLRASNLFLKPLRHASNKDANALARTIAAIASLVLLPFTLLGMVFASIGKPYRIEPIQAQAVQEQNQNDQIVGPTPLQDLSVVQTPPPQNIIPPIPLAPPIPQRRNSVAQIQSPPVPKRLSPEELFLARLGYTKEKQKALRDVYTSIQKILGAYVIKITAINELINKKSPELKAKLIHPFAYILEARKMQLSNFAHKPSAWRVINSAIYSAFINGAVEGIHSYNTWDYQGRGEQDISVDKYLKDFCTLIRKDHTQAKSLIDAITQEQTKELHKKNNAPGIFSAAAVKKCEELFSLMLS